MNVITHQRNPPFIRVFAVGLGLLLVLGLAFGIAAQDIRTRGVEMRIPDDANRIVLEQEGVPPADVYVDAVRYLEMKDFEMLVSEETFATDALESLLEAAPLNFSARKQINDTLALRITGDVSKIPGGGRLIASVEYADSVDTPIPEWKQAAWTTEPAKNAFFKALEIMRGTRYDAMDFEVGVAVEPR